MLCLPRPTIQMPSRRLGRGAAFDHGVPDAGPLLGSRGEATLSGGSPTPRLCNKAANSRLHAQPRTRHSRAKPCTNMPKPHRQSARADRHRAAPTAPALAARANLPGLSRRTGAGDLQIPPPLTHFEFNKRQTSGASAFNQRSLSPGGVIDSSQHRGRPHKRTLPIT